MDFWRGGRYGSVASDNLVGSPNRRLTNGLWWTSTSNIVGMGRGLITWAFTVPLEVAVYPTANHNRGFGMFIRCVVLYFFKTFYIELDRKEGKISQTPISSCIKKANRNLFEIIPTRAQVSWRKPGKNFEKFLT